MSTIVRSLGIDIGGTKTAWGVVDVDGNIHESGVFATPRTKDAFSDAITTLVKRYANVIQAVGIGIAGTTNQKTLETGICTNLPELSGFPLGKLVKDAGVSVVAIDNDARTALIGEVWLGAASSLSSAVLLTLGTGVGGAVMQKGVILPHPTDVSKEISRITVDQTDVFPSPCGPGSVEAFIGGKCVEERLKIDLAEVAKNIHTGDAEAKEIWNEISELFAEVIRAIHAEYSCKTIIIGGKGVNELEYYLGDYTPPCPVVAAALGEQAGMIGAARLGIDAFDEEHTDWE